MNRLAGQDTLRSGLRGELRHGELLARYTTWRVGGPAERFYRPADLEDTCAYLRMLPEHEPVLWLGLGSNLLVRDGGVPGTVIAAQGALQGLAPTGDRTLRAEAGVPCAKVARRAAQSNLCGVEFLAGIPGTIGGALAMNAGAWEGEMWSRVVGVEVVDRMGSLRYRRPEEYEIGYRRVVGRAEEWFAAAHLQLESCDGAASLLRIREFLDRRNRTQPTGVPSCGSVFRNPPQDHAARLIDTAGLKGRCIGGACVSQKHANFIVNTGAATAADIEALMLHVVETVESVHGVTLIPEVRVVGLVATGGGGGASNG